MIVATAGHVDHGKTSLIKALTGVDTDRLAEEKRRGMSIDLGFAYADLGGALAAGFVDVPGHERFLRNMLAGIAGVDCVLLVVAADDGLMPQTLEHLAIVELIGMARGVVALTRTDRVTPERVRQVAAEIHARLQAGSMREVAIVPVSVASGEGIDVLRQHLRTLEQTLPARSANGNFRLAIDCGFTLDGRDRSRRNGRLFRGRRVPRPQRQGKAPNAPVLSPREVCRACCATLLPVPWKEIASR
jgi:selenocysteine-specific elongation factor